MEDKPHHSGKPVRSRSCRVFRPLRGEPRVSDRARDISRHAMIQNRTERAFYGLSSALDDVCIDSGGTHVRVTGLFLIGAYVTLLGSRAGFSPPSASCSAPYSSRSWSFAHHFVENMPEHEQQGVERHVPAGGRDLSVHCKIRQERFDVRSAGFLLRVKPWNSLVQPL